MYLHDCEELTHGRHTKPGGADVVYHCRPRTELVPERHHVANSLEGHVPRRYPQERRLFPSRRFVPEGGVLVLCPSSLEACGGRDPTRASYSAMAAAMKSRLTVWTCRSAREARARPPRLPASIAR